MMKKKPVRKAAKKTAKKAAKKGAKRMAKKAVRRAPRKAAKKGVARPAPHADKAASEQISTRIAELRDWRGDVLRHVRALIKQADPAITEEWKWQKATSAGTPVWSHNGGVCTGESYKEVVKLTFFRGAALRDPAGLFNSSLDGNVRRAIDIRENDQIDEAAFKDLIRAAVSLNSAGKE